MGLDVTFNCAFPALCQSEREFGGSSRALYMCVCYSLLAGDKKIYFEGHNIFWCQETRCAKQFKGAK